MKTRLIMLFAALLSVTVSCNKDDDNTPASVNNANNKYAFQEKTIAITDAEYYFVDGDTYFFFKGEGVSDYVQLIFADIDGAVPVGAFTFHENRDDGYIPTSNFWGASVYNEATPLGFYTSGGSIIISNQPNGQHKITFTFLTNGGNVVGEFTGTLRQRE